MSLHSFLKEQIRISRAGKIAKLKSELLFLERQPIGLEQQKQINKIKCQIAKLEEQQKIDSEKNSRSNSTSIYSTNEKIINNGINTTIDLSKKQKSKK